MRNPWPRQVDGVLLREATEADLARLLEVRNEPEANRFMVMTSVDPEVSRARWLAAPGSEGNHSCVADVDGTVVGMGFLHLQDGQGQPGMPRGTEGRIGYLVDPVWAGRGVATRVARGLLAACFDDLGVRRVVAGAIVANEASVRVLEKVGMRREQYAVADTWHAELGWIDGCQYALLESEWREAQTG